jgi:peptide-methionine (R)-S-oxide reductase
MTDDMRTKPEEYWKEKLTPEQYRVLREAGTEPPFTGDLVDNHVAGKYQCAACGHELFSSDTKFESGSGWPSFFQAVDDSAVELVHDDSHGMTRVEVRCGNCGSHLGHLFPDGPKEQGGARYCMNSVSLAFKPKDIAT